MPRGAHCVGKGQKTAPTVGCGLGVGQCGEVGEGPGS